MISRSVEKLHRVDDKVKSDWENVSEEDRSILQKIAAKTNGVLTPANMLSVGCLAVFMSGLKDYSQKDYLKGATKMLFTRVGDILDGELADFTKTKSLTGAGVDASVDMIEVLTTLPVLVTTDTVGSITVGLNGAQRVLNTSTSLTGFARGVRIDAHENGKMGTFMMWCSIGMTMAAKVLEEKAPILSKSLKCAGTIGMIAGAVNSMPATIEYAQKGFGPKPDGVVFDFTDIKTQFPGQLETFIPS